MRRTLHPLVAEASSDAILSLRVLDPSMGSGAFLVTACRYLARAYETALVREGRCQPSDLTDGDRAGFRRIVAQRCLFGVDLNPMAVQLGRLSLWLASLAADRPLTFLDHHLRAGNSLIGASPDDLARQPPPGPSRRAAPLLPLPLFDTDGLRVALEAVVDPRRRIAMEPADTLSHIQEKERALGRLGSAHAPIARWKRAADLWCAGWFWPRTQEDGRRDVPPPPGRRDFAALTDVIFGRAPTLPLATTEAMLAESDRVAAHHHFFHWRLEFPEVFFDEHGAPLEAAGFDAVLGNPPWDMIRNDQARRDGSDASARLVRFVRGSGTYPLQTNGHVNSYQLFAERALSLVRRGGRIGMVLPGGLLSDYHSGPLRRHLLERCRIDSLVSFDNREGVFPIHRGLKFVLVAATTGGATDRVRCRFAVRRPDVLDTLPDAGGGAEAFPVSVTPALLARVSGPSLAIPELPTPVDAALASKIAAAAPPLGSAEGWHARFGRELNVTDDRRALGPPGAGLPVIEGKQIEPFHVAMHRSRFGVAAPAADRLLDRATTFGRPRLAYRDVASSTNRLTLIAAIVPPLTVTTHTVFCLKTLLDDLDQRFLCGVMNSYVLNYLVRQRVGTHVTTVIVEQLPVPRPSRHGTAFRTIAGLASRLLDDPGDEGAEAGLQAAVADLYGISNDELRHILATFPLVPAGRRDAALEAFFAADAI